MNNYNHVLRIKDNTRFFSKLNLVPIHNKEKVKKERNKTKKLGIIKPYKSNYVSSLDLTSNYCHIGLSETMKQYNAFRILNRVMEFMITIYLLITNLKGIRSLLDFMKCYTGLVNDYIKLIITWLELIRKHVRFKWQEYNSQVTIPYERRLFLARKINDNNYGIIVDDEKTKINSIIISKKGVM